MFGNSLGVNDRPVLESSSAHVAIALVLDISYSMLGEKINSLNRAINDMIAQLKVDARLRDIIDLGIFVFGEKGRNPVCQGFRAISDCETISLQANDDSTYVVDALNTAIDRLRERTELYAKGGGAHKPWLILITDGVFHDDYNMPGELDKVAERMKQREKEGKLHFFGLGVEGYKRSQLEKFTENPKRVIDIKAANFIEFFSWVGRSMATISRTAVGTQTTLEPLVFTV